MLWKKKNGEASQRIRPFRKLIIENLVMGVVFRVAEHGQRVSRLKSALLR